MLSWELEWDVPPASLESGWREESAGWDELGVNAVYGVEKKEAERRCIRKCVRKYMGVKYKVSINSFGIRWIVRVEWS